MNTKHSNIIIPLVLLALEQMTSIYNDKMEVPQLKSCITFKAKASVDDPSGTLSYNAYLQ